MTMGEKLRLARQQAQLSQRALCEGLISRNMLSLLESDRASPSVATLRALAERLGMPVGYFLDDAPCSAVDTLAPARAHFADGAFRAAMEAAAATDGWESELLQALCALSLARQCLAANAPAEAQAMLAAAAEHGSKTPYYTPATERERLALLAQVQQDVAVEADTAYLLALALGCVRRGELSRAELLLRAADPADTPAYHLVRGSLLAAQGEYPAAAVHLRKAEPTHAAACQPLLEVCCRETGDFQGAYFYACKQRGM